MLKHVKAIYEDGKLIFPAPEDAPKERTEVVVAYEDEARSPQPQSLYGIWKGKFPQELDLDKELAEIRGGWKKRFEKLA